MTADHKNLTGRQRAWMETLIDVYLTYTKRLPQPPMMPKNTWNHLVKFFGYAEVLSALEMLEGKGKSMNFRRGMRKALNHAYCQLLPEIRK
jgi:hypothetical protein